MSSPIRRQVPVEDYLRPQRRFAHLFDPVERRDVIDHIQAPADRKIARYRLLRRRSLMDKPFAITLDPAPASPTRPAPGVPSARVRAPAGTVRHACPAGEDVQGWLYHAEEGAYERAWRLIMEDNPLPAVMGRVCYHPCETACNRGQLDEAVGINAVERSWATRGSGRAGPSSRRAAVRQRVLVVGAGPSGPRPPTTSRARPQVRSRRRRAAGGMMRFGIPAYRLPRDVLDAEIQRILDLGVGLQLDSRVEDLDGAMREGGFDAAFVAVGAHLGKRAYIPPARPRGCSTRCRCCGTRGGEHAAAGPPVVVYGGGNTAMDAARSLGARRRGSGRGLVDPRRMPAHDSELQEALQEGVGVKWSRPSPRRCGRLLIERMELDAAASRSPRASSRNSGRLARPGPRPESDLSLLETSPGSM